MNKYILFFFATFTSCHFSFGQNYKEELTQKLQTVIKVEKIAGFSVAVFTSEKVLYQKTFGYSDLENQTPLTSKNTQVVASIAKTTIAVSLMKAQELGLLSLDDPINLHLPFEVNHPHFPNEKITIKHLTTHTSGLKYSELMTDHRTYDFADLNLESFLRKYLSSKGEWFDPINFHKKKPGTLADYSNVGATLAALIVERVSKMPFKDFTQQYIFKPLQMANTYWFDGTNGDLASKHYCHISKDKMEEVKIRKSAMYPDAFLATNIEDLTIFCQAIMKGVKGHNIAILKSISVKEMIRRHTPRRIKNIEGEKIKQGIFWYKSKNELGIPRKMIGHNGGDFGIFTMMFFDPKKDKGYILLSNTEKTAVNDLTMNFIYQNLYKKTKKVK